MTKVLMISNSNIVTGEDLQSELMNYDESYRVYWVQTRFLFLVYLKGFMVKVQL